MTRDEALATVMPFVQDVRGYRAVSSSDAQNLLGQERFDRLASDPIRSLGPADGYRYYWNVADYVQFPNLRKEPA